MRASSHVAARPPTRGSGNKKTRIDKENFRAYGAQTLVITGAAYREFLHGKQAYPVKAVGRE